MDENKKIFFPLQIGDPSVMKELLPSTEMLHSTMTLQEAFSTGDLEFLQTGVVFTNYILLPKL